MQLNSVFARHRCCDAEFRLVTSEFRSSHGGLVQALRDQRWRIGQVEGFGDVTAIDDCSFHCAPSLPFLCKIRPNWTRPLRGAGSIL